MVYKKKKKDAHIQVEYCMSGIVFMIYSPSFTPLRLPFFKLFIIISISLRLSAFLFYPHMFLKVPLTFTLF